MKRILLSATLWSLALNANSQILTENFEGGALPTGWTRSQSTPSVGWEFGASLGSQYWAIPTHTKYAASNDDANDDNTLLLNLADKDRLITPALDLTSPTAAVALSFDAFYSGDYGSVATIEVSTNGGSTWTPILTLEPSTAWQNGLVTNLSSYANQNNILVAFRHNDNADWASGFALDNVSIYIPPATDVRLNSVTLNRYALLNSNNTLAMNVTNLGSDPITSLTVDWNDGTSHSQVITGLNIAPFASANVNHPTAITYATAVEKTINVNITDVNSSADANPANNTGSTPFNTVSQAPAKKVIIEEGTGTWCGWCPRGAIAMEAMYTAHPNDFIGIAVHNNDPMTVAAYDNGANFSGFPGCNVDRAMLDQGVSETAFESYYQERIGLAVPAAISVVANGAGSSVTIDVTATFYTVFAAANYRIGGIIVEDNVKGTAAGYNQTNYYANNAAGAMGGYESLPDPVPAADMVYDHVGRALLGGVYSGSAGSVPTTITDGQTITKSFTYTVPATSNKANMKAVAILIDQTTGEIVNANDVALSASGISELTAEELSVYPNPASDLVNVSFDANNADYSVALMDLQGRVVSSKELTNANGAQEVSFATSNIAKGSYIVVVSSNGAKTTKTVVIK
jgi:hypothetical protein